MPAFQDIVNLKSVEKNTPQDRGHGVNSCKLRIRLSTRNKTNRADDRGRRVPISPGEPLVKIPAACRGEYT
ncbi:hypothetical protein AQUSIP_04750 [Aquicella siphonis]|uniref:Uncharacterized protein n=1 Tax=Aquicella siphonis TaxID=254247 RepID=A0A5E4PFC1_9COXI|nr:hypothetical protein AQUSIP_04750 [Aquicella siphonis]